MSDQIHTIDGSKATTPESAGADSPQPTESDESALTNVLQFPRDWFGPIEELEPIDLDPTAVPAQTASPVSAAAFWDEDAGSVHQLLDFPDGEEPDGGELATQIAEYEPAPARHSEQQPGGEAVSSGRSRLRPVGLLMIGLAALLLAGCVVVLASGALHHRAPGPAPARPRTRTRQSHAPRTQAPRVTVTTTVTTVRKARTPRPKATRKAASAKAGKSAAKRASEFASNSETETKTKTRQPVVTSAPAVTPTEAPVVHHPSQAPASSGATSTSSAHSGASASSTGSHCVQSPDSGCLP